MSESKESKIKDGKIYSCTHHIIEPMDYVDWHNWAERQVKAGHTQTQCKECGLWLFPEQEGAHE